MSANHLRLIDGDLAQPLTADQRAARKRDILASKLRRALDSVTDVTKHLRNGPSRDILFQAREEIGTALYMVEHCVLGISCPDDDALDGGGTLNSNSASKSEER